MSCKLTYFPLKALGEPIRMILTYNGTPFEDVRLERGEAWLPKKSSYPMGQVPILEIDGMKLHQSKAICRYLAKKSDLYGENEMDAVKIDMAADVIYDLIMKMRIPREISDPAAQALKYKEFQGKVIPFFLTNLNNMAKENKGYLGCSKLSWVDFYYAGTIEYLEYLCRMKFRDDYPHLKQVMENVYNHPKLKDYIKNREDTEF